MALIVSNHPDLEETAKQFGVDFELVSKTRETKAAQEEIELARLEAVRWHLEDRVLVYGNKTVIFE
ncbi:MAG: hypothetical protein GY811_07140 [Myxococcales bacterium]|nr:hypothetical protein [Myxococcales bacterium]